MVFSNAWRQISISRISSFTSETPKKKHQKICEGSSSSLAYPLKKTDQTVIAVAISTGQIYIYFEKPGILS